MKAGWTTRRDFLKFAGAGVACSVIPASVFGREPTDKRPNILLIVADDMGFSDAGCYGGEIETPNLDMLAQNGVRFTQMYSTGRCWPSRSCMLTGYYPRQIRVDPKLKGYRPLPPWTRLAPQYLKPAGYRCYHSGKWHVTGVRKAVEEGGFDRSYLVEDHDRYFSPRKHMEDDKKLPPVSLDSGYYSTAAIADHAIAYLKEHQQKHSGKPFFEYLAFLSPHFPLHALKEDIDRYRDKYNAGWDEFRVSRWKRMREMGLVNCGLSHPKGFDAPPPWNWSPERLKEACGDGEIADAPLWEELTREQKAFQATKMAIYAAMIDRMDREIGRVIDQLKAMGAYENTVIMFLSDNGGSTDQLIRGDRHDRSAKPGAWNSYLCLGPGWGSVANTPFRLYKSWNHEGGIASPFVVHWPNGLKAKGELRRTPCHFIDILPTLFELAGAKPAREWKGYTPPPLPGKSLVKAIHADVEVKREHLYFYHCNNRGLRVGDWKIAMTNHRQKWELYNLKNDRCEMNDLSKKHPDKLNELIAIWERCNREFDQTARM